METKKLLGGSLNKNIVMGLSYIIPLFGIIAFIIDFKTLDVEEKRDFVTIIVACVIATVVAFTLIGMLLSGVIGVLMIVAGIMAFMGKSFKIPGAYHIAKAIIKE